MTRLAMLAFIAGCALTSKSAPVQLRYFTPPEPNEVRRPLAVSPTRLRLGPIDASAALGYPIVRRSSAVEIVPYNTLRWTDRPETYVRRAVIRATFEARGIQQTETIDASTLDVEVLAFEEVDRDSRHFGRVELGYALRDRERVIARGVAAAEIPAASSSIEDTVTAIGAALDGASAQLADRVVSVLGNAKS